MLETINACMYSRQGAVDAVKGRAHGGDVGLDDKQARGNAVGGRLEHSQLLAAQL